MTTGEIGQISQPFALLEKWFISASEDIFVDDGKSQITAGEAWRHATQLAGILRGKGVRPGDTIAIDLPTSLNILFILAIFHEAAISLPFNSTGISNEKLNIDWLISNTKNSFPGIDNTIFVDSQLINAAQQQPHTLKPLRYSDENSICRIAFTSGTTGTPKPVAFSIKMLQARSEVALRLWMNSTPFMSLLDLGAASGFHTLYASLIDRRTYIVPESAEHNATQAERHKVKAIKASPIQISELMQSLVTRREAAKNLETIYSAGAILPIPVAKLVREITTAKIFNLYGSTEAGTVAARYSDFEDPADMGSITDGAEVEIVNEKSEPLPAGEVGIVRYRTSAKADAYFTDQSNETSALRDGWFYPGDRGFLSPENHLMLQGRESEIINAGGVKIDPARIDSVALDVVGVRDACAFSVESETGVTQIGLALVIDITFKPKELVETLTALLGKTIPTIMFQLGEIPRTTSGKPLRNEVAQSFLKLSKK